MENVKVYSESVTDDIRVASNLIENTVRYDALTYSEYSPIYKTNHENMSCKEYIELLRNKKRVLSLIGSGDQIINAILFGAEDIVGIDISRFPKYFLALKLAAIKSLNKKEYIEYFFGEFYTPFSITFYIEIRDNLDDESRLFWDSLYNKYSYQILYNSNLFNPFVLRSKTAVNNNPFLNDKYYNIVKSKIDKVSLELLKYNILNAHDLDKGCFDLILLSNLINYYRKIDSTNISTSEILKKYNDSIIAYKELLNSLPLTENGIAVTHNGSFYPKLKKHFKEENYEVLPVKENTKLINYEGEILVYKKSL